MMDWEILDVSQVGCCHGGLGDIRCGSSRMLPWWIGRY